MLETNNYDAVFLSYNGTNTVTLIVTMFDGVMLHKEFRLRGIFVKDEARIAKYLNSFDENVFTIKVHEKPEEKRYYLIDMYVGDNSVNEELIKLGIADKWKAA